MYAAYFPYQTEWLERNSMSDPSFYLQSLTYSMYSLSTQLMNNQMNKYAIEIFIMKSYFIMKWNKSLYKGALWKIVMYHAKSPHCLWYTSYIKFTSFNTIQKCVDWASANFPFTDEVRKFKEEWDMLPVANFIFCSFYSVIYWCSSHKVVVFMPPPPNESEWDF